MRLGTDVLRGVRVRTSRVTWPGGRHAYPRQFGAEVIRVEWTGLPRGRLHPLP